MTILDFLDKHWGFWLAVFLLILTGNIVNGAIALFAILVRLFKRGA